MQDNLPPTHELAHVLRVAVRVLAQMHLLNAPERSVKNCVLAPS